MKDYVIFRLTGLIAGELSVYNFSHYLDIARKEYWPAILDYCGVRPEQLPDLVEPQTVIGTLTSSASKALGLSGDVKVNAGTLDHFAGMIGTGNIDVGTISEATGTVLSIATIVRSLDSGVLRIPRHYGPFPDTWVYLPICESGGISLEWFKKAFLSGMDYPHLEAELTARHRPTDLVFLPYLTGVNAPDFNADASGAWFGLKLHHDRIDLAQAVMEGVAHLLKKNLEVLKAAGIRAEKVVSTGGGARSDYWSQVKADVTGYAVSVPEDEEAPSLGAGMIGAVAEGYLTSFKEGVQACVRIRKVFRPGNTEPYRNKQRLFELLYDQLLPVYARAAATAR